MILPQGISAYITEADNIYDLIGNCYGLLCESISNQAEFIAVYLSNNPEGRDNPNLGRMQRFFESVMYATQNYRPSRYAEFIENVQTQIRKIELETYEDSMFNTLTVIFFLLAGIDAGARSWESRKYFSSLGPLDRGNKTGYRVYFNVHQTLHSEYVDHVGRDRQHTSDFAEQFETFRFINTKEWKMGNDIPRVLFVPCDYLARHGGEKKLKIAAIPGSNERNFDFKNTMGTSLLVDYTRVSQEHIGNKVKISLEKAVEEGCDIVVFPEYITSPEVYRIIQSQIKKFCRKIPAEQRPWLIFCGTSWTEDSNNVMRVLDGWGEEIGEYYKYSPFTKKKPGEYGYKISEALSEPGKYCDLMAAEGVGIFLPAICRDVIDGKYTEEIVRLLHPFCVVIAAWSPSVNTFKERQKELANKFFTNSIFVNACSAVDKRRKEIGNAGIVYKRGTIPDVKTEPIKRDNCSVKCQECTCIYMVEYDFEYLKNGNNTINIRKM